MADETTATIEAPPAAPTAATAMAGWMSQLKTDLPQPSLGSETKKEPDGETRPEQPAPDDAKAPAGDTRPSAAGDAQKDAAAKPAEPAEEVWPRTAQEWKKRKESQAKIVAEREAKIGALEKELTETKSKITTTPKDSPEFQSLSKERDELSERLRVLEVTQHPKFVAYFKNKVDAQIGMAKSIVGAENAEKIEKLLLAPDSEWKRNELLSVMLDFDTIQQAQFGGVLNAMAEIERERAGEVAKSKESFELLQSQRTEKEKARQQGLEKLYTDIVGKAMDPKDGNPVYQKRANDEAWNKAVDERMGVVKELLVKGEPAKVIQAVLDAVAFPEVLKENLSLRGELAKAQEQVKKLTAANPGLNGARANGGGNGEQPAQKLPQTGTRPNEVIGDWMKGFGASMRGE